MNDSQSELPDAVIEAALHAHFMELEATREYSDAEIEAWFAQSLPANLPTPNTARFAKYLRAHDAPAAAPSARWAKVKSWAESLLPANGDSAAALPFPVAARKGIMTRKKSDEDIDDVVAEILGLSSEP